MTNNIRSSSSPEISPPPLWQSVLQSFLECVGLSATDLTSEQRVATNHVSVNTKHSGDFSGSDFGDIAFHGSRQTANLRPAAATEGGAIETRRLSSLDKGLSNNAKAIQPPGVVEVEGCCDSDVWSSKPISRGIVNLPLAKGGMLEVVAKPIKCKGSIMEETAELWEFLERIAVVRNIEEAPVFPGTQVWKSYEFHWSR